MSKIYEGFYRNIKKYPNKIFIYTLKKKFTGKDCLLYLRKTERFIKFNNIKSIGIKSINSFDWIILYLAADKLCSKVFIIKNGTSLKTTNKLKKTHNINYIVNKIPKKIIKIKKKKSFNRIKDKRVDILFTSGTTDVPKGVIINENSFIHVVKILIKKFNHNRFDLEFLSMPFDHSFGLISYISYQIWSLYRIINKSTIHLFLPPPPTVPSLLHFSSLFFDSEYTCTVYEQKYLRLLLCTEQLNRQHSLIL